MDYILRVWEKNKDEYLYKLFGEELILKKNVTFKKGNDNLVKEIVDFVFYHKFLRSIRNYALENKEYKNLLLLANSSTDLALNIYGGTEFTIKTPKGKEIKVRHGCKLVRMLGKIADEFGFEEFEDFRIAHSQILNQKELSGELCISIHPMDYLTMSDNDCGWDSCMSWTDHGDYRRGTVEMMNSPMVVVAYLTSDSPYLITNEKTWNNKKWRELFIVNEDLITHIKGYPYQSEDLNTATLNWLRELAQKNLGWEFKEEINMISQGCHSIINGKDHRFTFTTDYMYNDFYEDHAIYLTDKDIYDNYYCNFSGPAVCICCGEIDRDYHNPSLVSCDICDPVSYCDSCEEYCSDGLIEVDGLMLCESCYDDETIKCSACGEIHLRRNMKRVYIAENHNSLSLMHYFYVCDDCDFGDRNIKIYWGMEKNYSYRNYNYVLLEDCDYKLLQDLGDYETKEDVMEEIEEYRNKPWNDIIEIERVN